MRSKILLLIIILFAACQMRTESPERRSAGPVTDSVRLLLVNLQKGLSDQGSVVWLDYFDRAPGFYMAVDGQIAFKDYPTAKQFIETVLVKKIKTIHLTFSDLRIDSLDNTLASIGAGFHEDLADSSGKTTKADGYLTALAKQTPDGWKLANLHWSILK
jgi:SnoaL-like domain